MLDQELLSSVSNAKIVISLDVTTYAQHTGGDFGLYLITESVEVFPYIRGYALRPGKPSAIGGI